MSVIAGWVIPIAPCMYTQIFNQLCDKADDVYGGRLPVHVRCILDELGNIGKIPKFEKLIATIRSRDISASIILQSLPQLKAIYKDDADTIMDCCSATLSLGGKSKTTLKESSELLGEETIDLPNTSENVLPLPQPEVLIRTRKGVAVSYSFSQAVVNF